MDDQPTISTHVLDTEHGWPAKGVPVKLFRITAGGERPVGEGVTDEGGRINRLLQGDLVAADYRIEFSIDRVFFMSGSYTFRVADTTRSYHVPLLMAAYSLTAYRGS